jgi:hypothetical protein
VIGTFALQVAMRHAAQFGIDDRHEGIESFPIPVAPPRKELGYLF